MSTHTQAAEIARLEAVNADLLAALYHAWEALAMHNGGNFEIGGKTADSVIRAAIAKATGE